MTVALRVMEAIDRMIEGKPEAALIPICIAIDATVRKEYPQIKKDHIRFRKFLSNNLALITRTAFHNLAITKSLRLNFQHQRLKPGKDGLCSFEQIMYFVVRCGLLHEAEIPSTLKFTDKVSISVCEGQLHLPAGFINGMITAVVASPANASEKSKSSKVLNIDGETFYLSELWGCHNEVETLICGKRKERIAIHYHGCANKWAMRVVQSRSLLDLLVWAYFSELAATAVLKTLPLDSKRNHMACVLHYPNIDAERGCVGSAWSYISKEIGNAGGIGIDPNVIWDMTMCAYGVVDFEQRQDLKPVYDAFKAELRNNDQQRISNGGVGLINSLLNDLHVSYPTVAEQIPKSQLENKVSDLADAKSERHSSSFMSLKQFSLALDMDYRSFKGIAEIEWELKPENKSGTLWSINLNLVNDFEIEARIQKHAAKITDDKERRRHRRAT